MPQKLLDPSSLARWITALIAEHKVHGVQAKADRFVFDELARADDLRLDYDVTHLPPKKYFHPPRETLLRFDREAMTFESVFQAEPFILLGVHPYDMAAISQLDKVFSMGCPDCRYLACREAATIIACGVQTAFPEMFAGSMGHATLEGREGHDMLLTRLDDSRYLVDPVTPKGEALMGPLADAPEADRAALRARERVWARNRRQLRKHRLRIKPSELPGLLARSYDHPVWEEKAELCYSCGSCNLVCPTCYCFDVRDELDWDLRTGRRLREWGGCMLRGFAAVAGGHNFRARRADRYFRKGKYSWDAYGEIACVGCGCCISACTARIANPVDIFNRLLEDPR